MVSRVLAEDRSLLGPRQNTLLFTVWQAAWASGPHGFLLSPKFHYGGPCEAARWNLQGVDVTAEGPELKKPHSFKGAASKLAQFLPCGETLASLSWLGKKSISVFQDCGLPSHPWRGLNKAIDASFSEDKQKLGRLTGNVPPTNGHTPFSSFVQKSLYPHRIISFRYGWPYSRPRT